MTVPLIIAHRGASFDAPENTLAAFKLGFAQGADGIEGDFRLTSDEKVVCMHDDDALRTANTNLIIQDTLLSDLKELDVGMFKGAPWQGETIPTLGEVLRLVNGRICFIELKQGVEMLEPVLHALSKIPETWLANVRIIATSVTLLAALRARLPAAFQLFWVIEHAIWESWETSDLLNYACSMGISGLDLEAHASINTALVDQIHQAHLSVHTWTVDKISLADKLAVAGVSSITTNVPLVLRDNMQIFRDRIVYV